MHVRHFAAEPVAIAQSFHISPSLSTCSKKVNNHSGFAYAAEYFENRAGPLAGLFQYYSQLFCLPRSSSPVSFLLSSQPLLQGP